MFEDLSFEFDNLGPLGINLKSCLNGLGAYVDSFYDNTSSLARKKGLHIGDVIVDLNYKNITMMGLEEIKSLLVQYRGQTLFMTIHRPSPTETTPSQALNDLRNRLFIKRFLKSNVPVEAVSRRKYDLFCRIQEIRLSLPLPSIHQYKCSEKVVYNPLAEEWMELFPERSLEDNISLLTVDYMEEKLLKDLISDDGICHFTRSDLWIKRIAYYHRYCEEIDFVPLSSMILSEDVYLLYAWYLFLLSQHRSTIDVLRVIRIMMKGQRSLPEQRETFFQNLIEYLSNDAFVLRFYESELYQIYYQVTSSKDSSPTMTADAFLMHCLETILSLPSYIKVHFPRGAKNESSSVSNHLDQGDEIVASILRFTSTDEGRSYDARISFLADLRHQNFPSHPYIKELRKLSSLFLLPQAPEILHSHRSSVVDEVWQSYRSFILESFQDISSQSSHSSHSNGNKERSDLRFYYCGQMLIVLPDLREDVDLIWPDHIQFIEMIERHDLQSADTDTDTVAQHTRCECKDDDTIDQVSPRSETESLTSLPNALWVSTTEQLTMWSQRYRSTSAIKEDWVAVTEKLSSSFSKVTSSYSNGRENRSTESFEALNSLAKEAKNDSNKLGISNLDPKISQHGNLGFFPGELKVDERSRSPCPQLLALTLFSKKPQQLTMLQSLKDNFDGRHPLKEWNMKSIQASLLSIVQRGNVITVDQDTHVTARANGEEFSLSVVSELLSLKLLLTLYFAVLLECKIAFISPPDSTSICGGVTSDTFTVLILEWLKACLLPLTWEYPITSSMLPAPAVMEMIHCPTSFFIGMTSITFQQLLRERAIKLSYQINAISESKHNISNLLIFDIHNQVIIFPQDDRDNRETAFLKTIYHRSNQRVAYGIPPDPIFPLLQSLQKIFYPNCFSYVRMWESKATPIKQEARKGIEEEFLTLPHNKLTSFTPVDLSFPRPNLLPPDESAILQLLQNFTKELLLGAEECCLPIIKTEKVEQILFHEDLFFSFKYNQILTSINQARANEISILMTPSLSILLQSFVCSQAFSNFLSSKKFL